MRRRGFTLIEALLGLGLSLFIVTTGLELYARAQKSFLRLKDREEAGQAALAALDKIRIDLLHSGRGLSPEAGLGLVEPVEVIAGELQTTSLEKPLDLASDAQAGDTRLALVSTADIAAGQRIVLRQGPSGEARTVTRVVTGGVLIESPLERGYARESAAVSLLERVTYARDGATRVLRRKVNASSAQPLLEDTAAVRWDFDAAADLVRIRLELDTKGARPYEATVFLKNPALARQFGT
jgi:type II secretory pathway pseudopilin PulG